MADDVLHILIIDAPYYAEITAELLAGATAVLDDAGVTYERISVPGVFEIPAALSMASLSGDMGHRDYDGYILLGCVIRGETSHYDIVANESARALQDLAVSEALAVGNGILTVDNADQAWARAKRDQKNKGRDAAEAALRMAQLRREMGVTEI
ncbi:MAG: 6,7-dimethyl-8-ribityllumazine synthase [Pseudomonadota bacterium]